MNRIYLDHAATTPLAPRARDAMAPWLGPAANASSLHAEGRAARQAVDEARESVARNLGCLFGEVVFTSSGTEAVNLAVMGTALAHVRGSRRRVLFGAAEHHAVLHCQPLLALLGFEVAMAPVDSIGVVDLARLEELCDDSVLMACVMAANNETGAVNPIDEVTKICQRVGALLLTDAVQMFPLPASCDTWGPDMVAVSAHKFNGPQGAAALYARSGLQIRPLSVGGGQEREMRAGTENVAAIMGMAEAARLAVGTTDRRRPVRDAFAKRLTDAGFEPTVPAHRIDVCLPGHFHCRFPGIDAETMLIRLDRAGVAASSGAACSSGSLEPSHVLLACGWTLAESKEGLRFSLGRETAHEEAEEAARRVIECATGVMDARQA